jgi:hypothetical protein
LLDVAGDDACYAAAALPGGGVMLCVTVMKGQTATDIYFVEYDAQGTKVQQKQILSSTTVWTSVVDMLRTEDGGFVLAGSKDGDAWLAKYSDQGVYLWGSTHGTTGTDGFFGVIRTGDGGYAAAGQTTNPTTNYFDAYLLKVDNSGVFQWQQTYGGAVDDRASDIAQAPNGDLVLAGYTQSMGAGDLDAYVVRATSTGSLVWEKAYGGTGHESADAIVALASSFVFAGTTQASSLAQTDMLMTSISDSGGQLWSKTYGDSNSQAFGALAARDDGGFIAAGHSCATPPAYDFYFAGLSAAGAIESANRYGGSYSGAAAVIVPTTDGGFVIAGSYNGSTDSDVLVVKTGPDGNDAPGLLLP